MPPSGNYNCRQSFLVDHLVSKVTTPTNPDLAQVEPIESNSCLGEGVTLTLSYIVLTSVELKTSYSIHKPLTTCVKLKAYYLIYYHSN